MKTSNANKVISVLVSVAMCPMMLPTAAFATENDAASNTSSSVEQAQPANQAEGVEEGAGSSNDTLAAQPEAVQHQRRNSQRGNIDDCNHDRKSRSN